MAKAKKKETLTPEERLQAVLVPDWEQPYKVPENWCWIHLLDSFENCTDSKKKIPQKEYLQDGKIAVVDQLIKILGMLGICKTEDCLVLMDEPDAYMNPRWKYEIKETMDNSLRDAINTQAIVATHDPLVINGVPKEFIRIFTHNENLVSNNGYYFTKVIVPTEDTEGMGIDGLLQSEYYGLSSVLDSETKDKMDEKHRLLIKKKDGTITDNEKYKLLELTNDLENMSFTRNIPTDSYYDEYVAAMHKIYSERPHVNLSAEDIAERNAKAEEILKGLLEK